MAEIGALNVRIGADTSGLERGLRRAQIDTKKFGRGLADITKFAARYTAAIGAAAAAVGGVYVRASMRAIDETAKFADMVGVGTKELVGLQYAAKITAGVASNQFNMALQRMTRRISEAARGTGEAQDAIKQLGLDAQELNQMGPDQAFLRVADAMEQVGTRSDRVAMAFKLFDSEGAKLVNTLNAGTESIRNYMEEAEALGVAFNRVDAAKIEQANDALASIGEVIRGVANRIAIELAPYLQGVAEAIRDWAVASDGFRSTIESVMTFVLGAIGRLGDGILMVQRGWAMMSYGVSQFGNAAVQAFTWVFDKILAATAAMREFANTMIRGMRQLPGMDFMKELDTSGIDRLREKFAGFAEESSATLQEAENRWVELLQKPWPSEGIAAWLEDVKAKSDEAAQAIAKAREGQTGDGENGDKNLPGVGGSDGPDLEERLAKVREFMASEAELEQQRHAERLATLREALQNEIVTRQEFNEMEAELSQEHAERMRELEVGQQEEKLERLRNFLQTEREAEIEAHEQRMEWLREAREKELVDIDEFNVLKQELEQKHQDELSKIKEKGEKDRSMIRRMFMNEDVKMTADNMGKAVGEVQQGMQAMFADTKLGAISMGILKRLQSILNAYEWGSAIGGPPMGAAAAAAAAATTMATLSNLKSTQYGSSGGGGSGGSSGGGSVQTPAASQPQQQQPTQRIMIDGLGDDSVMSGRQVRRLIDQINEAQQDGARLLVV